MMLRRPVCVHSMAPQKLGCSAEIAGGFPTSPLICHFTSVFPTQLPLSAAVQLWPAGAVVASWCWCCAAVAVLVLASCGTGGQLVLVLWPAGAGESLGPISASCENRHFASCGRCFVAPSTLGPMSTLARNRNRCWPAGAGAGAGAVDAGPARYGPRTKKPAQPSRSRAGSSCGQLWRFSVPV